MKSNIRIAMLVAAAGCATHAFAQDSVSINSNGGNGLPGDALSYTSTAEQRASFVVDLSEITTSWGTKFRIGPIAKSNKAQNAVDTFFSMFWSANSISQTMLNNVPPVSASYSVWSTPGAGVNPVHNTPGTTVSAPSLTTQFAIGGYANGDEFANPANPADIRRVKTIVSNMVNFDPANPNRMYVTRTHAASNTFPFNASLTATQNAERSALGYGSIDANGNVYFRADISTGSTLVPANPDRIAGNNIFRVRTTARNPGVLNTINNAGGSDPATDRIVNADPFTFACPGNLPADLAGNSTGRYIGLKFQTVPTDLFNYAVELAPNVATRGTSVPTPQDTRGNANFTKTTLFPNTVGTMGWIRRDSGTPSAGIEDAFTLQLHGINAAGVLSNKVDLRRPAASLVDNSTAYSWPENAFGSVFRHYQGITAFNGGVQVAVGKESTGQAVAAAVLYNDKGAAAYNAGNPMNALAVCRFDPANPAGTAQWALAGWNESVLVTGVLANAGKAILDGPGGNTIGRMCSLAEVTNFVVPFGPSISAPVFDSKGNIWFLTAAELYNRGPQGESDFDTVLVRGVYNPTNFSYDLELVLEQGTVIAGGNSGLNYRITFLELAYVGGGASANGNFSPGSLSASSGNQAAWNNIDPSDLSQTDSRALGGLVLQAKIVYDIGDENGVDGPDGFFDDPTGVAAQYPNSRDEAYRAILYIAADVPAAPPCVADFNGDTVVDFFDYLDFVDAFSAEDPSADFNADTVIDFFDYLDFVDAFSIGCE